MSPPGPFVLSGTRHHVLAGTEEGFSLRQHDQLDPARAMPRTVRDGRAEHSFCTPCHVRTTTDGSPR
jgi:hypothetical protein